MPENIITTNPQDGLLLIRKEEVVGVLPENPVWQEKGASDISLDITKEQVNDEEFNPDRFSRAGLDVSAETGGTITCNLNYSPEIETLLESLFNNEFDGNTLEFADNDITLSIADISKNAVEGIHERYINGANVSACTFTVGNNAIITMENTVTGISLTSRYKRFVYQDDSNDANVLVGGNSSIWINTTSGEVFDYDGFAFDTTPIGTFVSGATWLAGAVDPTSEGVDDDFYLNTASGEIFKKVSNAWVSQFTFNPSTWTASTAVPTGGNERDLHLKTDDGAIYENQYGTWVLIANFKLTSVPAWYTGATVTPKTTNNPMLYNQSINFRITGNTDEICFTEATITIDNSISTGTAICSKATEALGLKRNIKTKETAVATLSLTIPWKSQELYDRFLRNDNFSIEMVLNDGTQGYKFTFHNVQISEHPKPETGGSIDSAVTFNIFRSAGGQTITIEKIPDISVL